MTELEMLIKKNYEDFLKAHGIEGKQRKHPTYESFKEIFTLGMVTQWLSINYRVRRYQIMNHWRPDDWKNPHEVKKDD